MGNRTLLEILNEKLHHSDHLIVPGYYTWCIPRVFYKLCTHLCIVPTGVLYPQVQAKTPRNLQDTRGTMARDIRYQHQTVLSDAILIEKAKMIAEGLDIP